MQVAQGDGEHALLFAEALKGGSYTGELRAVGVMEDENAARVQSRRAAEKKKS